MAIGTRQTIAIGTDEIPKVLESVAEDDSEIADVVVVASSALPTGAATETTLAAVESAVDGLEASATSIDEKITACNTGAVVVAASALPTGAATAAEQPAIGTAGDPSADVLTVQGVSGGTPVPAQASNSISTVAATIADDASLSGAVDLGAGMVLCAIDMPADWTAANLTFQASTASDGTYDNLYDQYGTEKNVTAAEDRYIPLDDPAFWLGVRYLKVRSGTAASAVVQDRVGGTVVTLVVKPV